MKRTNTFKLTSLGLIWVWLSAFAILPFACMFVTSFLPDKIDAPVSLQFTLQNYQEVLSPIYRHLLGRSVWLGIMTTFICLLIAYPYALILSQIDKSWRHFLLLLTIIPFWTSSLLRTYAIINILKTHGPLNKILLSLHIIKTPLLMLFTKSAVMLGLIYNLLPFMILPLYSNIERLDPVLFEAAHDLGANAWTTLTKITLPQTLLGILNGCTLVFLPAITVFYIPDLLGGAKSMLLGNLIQHEFLIAQDWPLGSAIGMSLLAMILFVAASYSVIARETNRKRAR